MPPKELVKHKTHLMQVICYEGDMLEIRETYKWSQSQCHCQNAQNVMHHSTIQRGIHTPNLGFLPQML